MKKARESRFPMWIFLIILATLLVAAGVLFVSPKLLTDGIALGLIGLQFLLGRLLPDRRPADSVPL